MLSLIEHDLAIYDLVRAKMITIESYTFGPQYKSYTVKVSGLELN